MVEKRIYKRQELICYMKVYAEATDTLIGHIIDMTPEGMLVMCQSQMDVDRPWRLKIELQKNISAQDFISVDAVCKWCRKESHTDFYDAGFEFSAIAPEARQVLDTIIASLCFQNSPAEPA